MSYAIIGTGTVGKMLARFFQQAGVEVALANSRGAETVEPIASEIGDKVIATSREQALDADVIFFAVQYINFKDLASARSDWAGKIVVDVTNAAYLPQDVQDRELQGRPGSVVNAERLPGGKLVKTFNQHFAQWLAGPAPAGGKRVMFVASDHDDASKTIAQLLVDFGFAPIELGRLEEGGLLIEAKHPLAPQNLVKFDA